MKQKIYDESNEDNLEEVLTEEEKLKKEQEVANLNDKQRKQKIEELKKDFNKQYDSANDRANDIELFYDNEIVIGSNYLGYIDGIIFSNTTMRIDFIDGSSLVKDFEQKPGGVMDLSLKELRMKYLIFENENESPLPQNGQENTYVVVHYEDVTITDEYRTVENLQSNFADMNYYDNEVDFSGCRSLEIDMYSWKDDDESEFQGYRRLIKNMPNLETLIVHSYRFRQLQGVRN